MDMPHLNVYSINYTLEDRRTAIKNMILMDWLQTNQPELISKVEQYVQEHITNPPVGSDNIKVANQPKS